MRKEFVKIETFVFSMISLVLVIAYVYTQLMGVITGESIWAYLSYAAIIILVINFIRFTLSKRKKTIDNRIN